MVELECDACGTTDEFPATLEVVDREIDGWEVTVSVADENLVVTGAKCGSCQVMYNERVEQDILETIEAAQKYMTVEPTVEDIRRMCEYDVSVERVEEVMHR